MTDLSHAIKLSELAIDSAKSDSRCGRRLASLAVALLRRFQHSGNPDDLDQSIKSAEESIRLLPDSHLIHPSALTFLGISLQRRYEMEGSSEDQDCAVVLQEKAVKLTDLDNTMRAGRLNNLGNSLQMRFDRTKQARDLDRAISAQEEAVALTSTGFNRVGRLSNLATALHSRYRRTESLSDLHRAISMLEQAVSSSSAGHADRLMCLRNLGVTLLTRFEKTRSGNDLNVAIANLEKAVSSAPSYHFMRTSLLRSLGDGFQKRFEAYGSPDDLTQAICAFENAITVATSPPSERIRAAKSASVLLMGRDMPRVMSVLGAAVKLLPAVSPRVLNRTDQQFNISGFANITANAVSASLECGKEPGDALYLFELGRGVLANLHFELRSDDSRLKTTDLELAQEFNRLRDKINSLLNHNTTHEFDISSAMYGSVDYYRTLSQQFDEILTRIRSLPGFTRFLQGPTEDECKILAENGPIAVLNVSSIRSDALLITRDKIWSLPLPLLRYADLQTRARDLLDAIYRVAKVTSTKANRMIGKILQWLWDVAVGPVLDALGFRDNLEAQQDRWERMWWIGNGLINVLPLHVAGYHDTSPRKSALDRVLSSYASSLKALAYARERLKTVSDLEISKALLVSMPETPGQTELPFEAKEVSSLESLLAPRLSITALKDPTKQGTLSALQDCQVAHFACHGISVVEDPSKSTLLLTDWSTNPLTVSDLMSIDLRYSQLAYLSACHTASARVAELLDESIHLSSAMQIAGFPSVIGTLWQVEDTYSANIATDTYRRMLTENKFDPKRSAEALHWAIRTLRDQTRVIPATSARKGKDNYLSWAPYVHTGA